jgi:predicted DNA binding CopG/RHH family protein
MAKKFTRRVSLFDAIALHAEANKSDPFAAKRMAMTLRNRNDKPKEVAAEAQRIIDARAASVKKSFAEWLKSEQRVTMMLATGNTRAAIKADVANRMRRAA